LSHSAPAIGLSTASAAADPVIALPKRAVPMSASGATCWVKSGAKAKLKMMAGNAEFPKS
jgi:hypothetical protein